MPVVHLIVRNTAGKEIKVEINRTGAVYKRYTNPGRRVRRPLMTVDVHEEDRYKVEASRKLAVMKVIVNLTTKKLECTTDEMMVIDAPSYSETIKQLCTFDKAPDRLIQAGTAESIVKFIEDCWLVQNSKNYIPDQVSDDFDLDAEKENIDYFVLDLPAFMLPAVVSFMRANKMGLMIHDEKLGLIEV